MKTKPHIFKTFPEFSKLTLADKEAYESLIAGYPPLADLSFATLMTWWSPLDGCKVAILNDCLVVEYWLPGDDENSGLCLIGTKNVDESIATIFDWQKSKDEAPRLVHVPEFVMQHMQFTDMFTFIPERDYDESIYSVSNFYPMNRMSSQMRRRAEKFLAMVDEDKVTVKTLDLRERQNVELLLESEKAWFEEGTFNDVANIERSTLETALVHADELEIHNICLFEDERLVGFQLYEQPTDKRYVIATFIKVDCSLPGIFEYMYYVSAKWYAKQGATHINFEQDLGIPRLRAEKLMLGPVNYFRKYTIAPRG